MPGIFELLGSTRVISCAPSLINALRSIFEAGARFSYLLHSNPVSSTDDGEDGAFYRAFTPEIGTILYPRQVELVKRCQRSEVGEGDVVGACVFPVRYLTSKVQVGYHLIYPCVGPLCILGFSPG